MKLWLTLRVLGTDTLGNMIDKGFENAEIAQKRLGELPDWEIISPAQMAIVVFRYAPTDLNATQLDELNRAVSKRAIETNTACILTTQIRGQTVLRIVSIQPDLGESDMMSVIDNLNSIALELRQKLY
jgi:L-2,4-diaminobutyrate decarboxylase